MSLQAVSAQDAVPEEYVRAVANLAAEELELLHNCLLSRARTVLDSQNESLGESLAALVDRESGRPQWLAVVLASEHRTAIVGVPVDHLKVGPDRCWVSFPAALVRSAPSIDPDGLTADDERALCRHYGRPPTPGASLSPNDRRVTGSCAFWNPGIGEGVAWLPCPRGDAAG